MKSFAEFWPFYVLEHANPLNRRLHAYGTVLGVVVAAGLVFSGNGAFALLTPAIGYGFAWFGHFVVQKNRPATFTYPLWSLAGDFKMLGLMITGKMDGVVADVLQAKSARH